MRILIAAPPKAGNSWLKCLLAEIYGLEWYKAREARDDLSREGLQAWVEEGGFPDGTVFHHHFDYSEALLAAAAAIPAHVVSIVRDPYDAFVSQFFFRQAQAENRARRGRTRPGDVVVGKPIDHPDVLARLREDGFRGYLEHAEGWLRSGVPLVRYEALHAEPVAALEAMTDRLQPVETPRIAHAVASCDARALRAARPGLRKRIRAATVGDWRNHLGEAHLAVFRERYAEAIRRLGYEVR